MYLSTVEVVLVGLVMSFQILIGFNRRRSLAVGPSFGVGTDVVALGIPNIDRVVGCVDLMFLAFTARTFGAVVGVGDLSVGRSIPLLLGPLALYTYVTNVGLLLRETLNVGSDVAVLGVVLGKGQRDAGRALGAVLTTGVAVLGIVHWGFGL